jgi:predicted class III extradiol MEMO1 family dioxygenase
MNLDFMPSPSPEHPGLFIRDPYRFSDAMLVIPPPLVECLQCFDGLQSQLDLRAALVTVTGELEVGQLAEHLAETLSAAGFLEDANYAEMQQDRKREFAEAAVREPSHAGSAYPADADEMRETMGQYMSGAEALAKANGDLFAIAAPHVSPQGGWQSYRAAYGMLRPEHKDRTFVILATSHYGEPEKFGLTRKTFRTPLGDAPTDTALVDRLAARGGKGIEMEDFCHSFEHTVELQVIFLQHVLGPGVKILPVLVGPFAHSIYKGGNPEDHDNVKAFFDALGELREQEGDRLFCGFWDLVRERQDDLKWCGSSPFYTFLKTAPKARGELLKYEQWNIDENSVVSFAGMGFRKA